MKLCVQCSHQLEATDVAGIIRDMGETVNRLFAKVLEFAHNVLARKCELALLVATGKSD